MKDSTHLGPAETMKTLSIRIVTPAQIERISTTHAITITLRAMTRTVESIRGMPTLFIRGRGAPSSPETATHEPPQPEDGETLYSARMAEEPVAQGPRWLAEGIEIRPARE